LGLRCYAGSEVTGLEEALEDTQGAVDRNSFWADVESKIIAGDHLGVYDLNTPFKLYVNCCSNLL
jgi:hypothetical protein